MVAMRTLRRRGLPGVSVAAVLTVAASCGAAGAGSSESAGAPLPPDAAAGRDVARDHGCAGCHGPDFAGGVGPSWVGLAGSTVELDDGTAVVADSAYLTRAIADPRAERVDGYAVAMPDNDLTDEEIAQVVAYIEALGEDSP